MALPTHNAESKAPDDPLYFDDIPSSLEVALNGPRDPTYRSITATRKHDTAHSNLLDPESFRRGSFSTISGLSEDGRSRGRSTASHVSYSRYASRSPAPPRTWRGGVAAFWQRNRGLALVMGSQFFGAVMNVTTRVLELEGEGMHPFQLLFVRFGITVVLAVAYMWYTGVEDFPFGKKEVRVLLCFRGLFGFFGVFGLCYSLMYLPLADATVISFLAPPVAGYACYMFFGERFTRMEQIASFVALSGVVLIARPTSFFHFSNAAASPPPPSNSTTTHIGHDFPIPTTAQRLSGVGVALTGVLGAAGALTMIRWIGKRAHPLISVNFFSVWCTIVSTVALSTASHLPEPFTQPDLKFKLPANLRQWGMMFMLGICGFIMQFLLTAGVAHEKSNRATNMIYTNMLFALLFDRLVFGTVPGLWSLLGSGLILGSAVYVAVNKSMAPTGNESSAAGVVAGGVPDEEVGMLQDVEGEEAVPLQEVVVHNVESIDELGDTETNKDEEFVSLRRRSRDI